VTDTNTVRIKGRSYTTSGDAARQGSLLDQLVRRMPRTPVCPRA